MSDLIGIPDCSFPHAKAHLSAMHAPEGTKSILFYEILATSEPTGVTSFF